MTSKVVLSSLICVTFPTIKLLIFKWNEFFKNNHIAIFMGVSCQSNDIISLFCDKYFKECSQKKCLCVPSPKENKIASLFTLPIESMAKASRKRSWNNFIPCGPSWQLGGPSAWHANCSEQLSRFQSSTPATSNEPYKQISHRQRRCQWIAKYLHVRDTRTNDMYGQKWQVAMLVWPVFSQI